jgi:hypothetical protein
MKTKKLVIFMMIVCCTACMPATPRLTKEESDKQLVDTIAIKQKLWEELDITNYKIELSYSSVWNNYNLMVTIKDNKVTSLESNCGEALLDIEGDACKEFISKTQPQDYMVEGLFRNISDAHKNFKDFYGSEINWSEAIVITFNQTYHFPDMIDFDHPHWDDDQYTIRVRNFEVIQR